MAHETRRSGLISSLLWGALGSLVFSSCAPEVPDAASSDRPNVLVIAVDTLRADRLGCYGNPRGLTPNIDRLATEGARFEHAFSHAPWTLPSFASLFSSLTPPEHGAGGNIFEGWRSLPPAVETLAERFVGAGRSTAAIVNVDFLSETFGLMQGFQHVDARVAGNNRDVRDAGATTAAALTWLDARPTRPFFLFVHYFDPHAEYAPPQPFRRRFAQPQDAETDGFTFGTREQMFALRQGLIHFRAQDVERAEALYDGEVAYTDAEIGTLLQGIAARGLDETTLIVFTADHGEEFFDHGGYEHGHSLYDELLHVPLIVRFPARIAPRVIDSPVAHIDVAPTVCALAKVPPAPAFRGRNLEPLLAGRDMIAPPFLAHGNFWGKQPFDSLRVGEYKLIRTPGEGAVPARLQLFRWIEDPREAHDLNTTDAQRAGALDTQLGLCMEQASKNRAAPAPVTTPSGDALKRLSDLGYVQSDGQPPPPAPVPK